MNASTPIAREHPMNAFARECCGMPPAPPPSLVDSMKRAARQLTVDEQEALVADLFGRLPVTRRVEVLRSLAAELSGSSYAFDRIDAGLDDLADELRDEQLVVERGMEAVEMRL